MSQNEPYDEVEDRADKP